MPDVIPNSVRYIKSGAGGRWWKAAKAGEQVHAGWSDISHSILLSGDLIATANALGLRYVGGKRGFKQDLNQLLALLDHPSQHLWITFEEGCMWWCTVGDGIVVNPEGESRARGHPDVAEVAAIGVPSERWGEEVRAIVVLRPGAQPDPDALITWARGRIAGYKAPKSVDFTDMLPRNASGKILRRELRAPYWAARGGRPV